MKVMTKEYTPLAKDFLTKRVLSDKEKEYLEYIDTHKSIVWKVWFFAEELITNVDSDTLDQTKAYVKIHDDSKYSDKEFYTYRKKFYPEPEELPVSTDDWQRAWRHHYKNNPHHWEHFLDSGYARPMPENYVLEMLCDWTAMAIAKKSSLPSVWYAENKIRMALHDETVELIEKHIEAFDEVHSRWSNWIAFIHSKNNA